MSLSPDLGYLGDSHRERCRGKLFVTFLAAFVAGWACFPAQDPPPGMVPAGAGCSSCPLAGGRRTSAEPAPAPRPAHTAGQWPPSFGASPSCQRQKSTWLLTKALQGDGNEAFLRHRIMKCAQLEGTPEDQGIPAPGPAQTPQKSHPVPVPLLSCTSWAGAPAGFAASQSVD